jgi:stage IV sporulation protein FB
MMLGAPEVTAYDLRFRLLNIPVRVHPLFWLVMLLISGSPNNLKAAMVFMAAAFVSVLVHEFGHGLSSRFLGQEPGGIVLYAMGGFCYFWDGWQAPWKRLIVLACGPGAGFLLLGLVLAFGQLFYGIAPIDAIARLGFGYGHGNPLTVDIMIRHELAFYAFLDLVQINLLWGILNLFPIWPLDGGQMIGIALSMVNRREGTRWGHVVSLLTAGLFALWLASRQRYFNAIWIGYFGFINYEILQTMHRQSWLRDDSDWWRR